MTTVTLTEAGVALILLEQELRNNEAEVARWERRVNTAKVEMRLAIARRDETIDHIRNIKESLK